MAARPVVPQQNRGIVANSPPSPFLWFSPLAMLSLSSLFWLFYPIYGFSFVGFLESCWWVLRLLLAWFLVLLWVFSCGYLFHFLLELCFFDEVSNISMDLQLGFSFLCLSRFWCFCSSFPLYFLSFFLLAFPFSIYFIEGNGFLLVNDFSYVFVSVVVAFPH